MSKKTFIGSAIILMIAGFIVKILGFFYRIYLANLIGAEGMGLFQLMSPVYSLVILTLTSGVSIAVSRLVAEECAHHNYKNARKITYTAFFMVLTGGLVLAAVMFFNIDFITGNIIKDSRTYYPTLLLLPCIPVIAAASAIKGYFYGIQDVVPTALSQIVEQLVRIGLVLVMAGYFLDVGLEYACALAVFAMAIGEISNLAVVYIFFTRKKKKLTHSLGNNSTMRKRMIIKKILKISMPVSLNRFITSTLFAIEVIMIPRRLLAGGMDYQLSIEEYGRLTGMAMPLIFFPSLVTMTLATTLVPAISEDLSLKRYKGVNYKISKSIQLSFILGFIFTAIFISFPHKIGDIVYNSESVGHLLYLLSFTCVFMYLQQTLFGILNGLGRQAITLRNNSIGNIIRIGFVYYMVPLYGVKGYIWGIIVSVILVCILNIFTVVKTTGMMLDFRNWVVKPGLICVLMIFTAKYMYTFFNSIRINDIIVTGLSVGSNLCLGMTLLVMSGALNRQELFKLIKGSEKR